MHEVKIYGEIVPFQDTWVTEEPGYSNLSSVQAQLKEAKGEDVLVRISSYGGDVDEGFAIYSELRRYAKDNKASVTTFTEGRCASIATVIFLAGDKRILNEYVEPFVHNAWTYAMGDAKDISRIAADLEKASNQIAEHYALHTDLTVDEARALMDANTSITAEEAVKIRFATEIEEITRPVALQRFSKKPNLNINKMANKKESNILAKIKNLLGQATILNKIVFDAENNEVDFYELGEDDMIEVGAMATIGGQPAEGEIVMASGETYVFAAGELTEIREAEPEDDEDDIEALKAENEELKTQLADANAKAETATTEATNLKAKVENLSAVNSKNMQVIKNIKALEASLEIDEPRNRPNPNPAPESRAKSALANIKK